MVTWASQFMVKYETMVTNCTDETKHLTWFQNGMKRLVVRYRNSLAHLPFKWACFNNITMDAHSLIDFQVLNPLDCTANGIDIWLLSILELMWSDLELAPMAMDLDAFMVDICQLGLGVYLSKYVYTLAWACRAGDDMYIK
jgi:hypothetical protein